MISVVGASVVLPPLSSGPAAAALGVLGFVEELWSDWGPDAVFRATLRNSLSGSFCLSSLSHLDLRLVSAGLGVAVKKKERRKERQKERKDRETNKH